LTSYTAGITIQPFQRVTEWRHFYLARGTKAKCGYALNCAQEISLLTCRSRYCKHV